MTNILQEVLAANQRYAADFGDKAKLAMPPARHFAILTCMDARLDPAKFAGLAEGDAHVIRNAGGRASDSSSATVIVGKSKTVTGSGRTIPLNSRTVGALTLWASQFPLRRPEDFVFPSERYGAAGDVFEACAYNTDPSKPISSWKVAWEAAKHRAGAALQGKKPNENGARSLRIRFHDLRHTACTRMLEGGVPYPVVASIMGWSASTSIRMAKRYGHIGQIAQRQAVAMLEGAKQEVESFEKSPELLETRGEKIQ